MRTVSTMATPISCHRRLFLILIDSAITLTSGQPVIYITTRAWFVLLPRRQKWGGHRRRWHWRIRPAMLLCAKRDPAAHCAGQIMEAR